MLQSRTKKGVLSLEAIIQCEEMKQTKKITMALNVGIRMGTVGCGAF